MTIFEQHTHELLQQACKNFSELSLRDLFAMSAINGVIGDYYINSSNAEEHANSAYLIADAMLERSKK